MPLKVLISGSTGFIGRHLSSLLQSKGFEIYPLVREKNKKGTLFWDPDQHICNLTPLQKVDAVIHLCGENVSGYWTTSKKQKIYNSRILSTKFLVESLHKANIYPKVFVSASAIGYFGSRGEEVLTESSSKGGGFLSDVCADWENQLKPLNDKSRVISLRFGHVLGKDGGVLPKLSSIYRLALGGKIGSGNQYISWISIDDLSEIVFQCILHEYFTGPINCVSLNPIRQKEFGKTLATVLRRPFWFHLPEKCLVALFKEQAKEMLLASQRVIPEKLKSYGYSFVDTDLKKTFQKYLKFIQLNDKS